MDATVTIGMPVRNAGEQIRKALDSLLSQSYQDIHIVISDNCSTDNTVGICREYAARDSRITLVEQPRNLGICGNFRYVLSAARTPYFMWACHDDWWAQSFIEKNLANLRSDPDAIGSVSRVILVDDEGRRTLSRGTAPMIGTTAQRVRAFLKKPTEGSRFYSVFHTGMLRECFPDDIDVFGYDFIVLALAHSKGKFLEVPETLMEREQHDFLYYQRNFVARRPSWSQRWFAGHDLVRKIREKISLPYGSGFRRSLLNMELRHTAQYAAFKVPVLLSALALMAVVGRHHGNQHSVLMRMME